MADRRGAANLGIPLMLGTLVLLGGFFYYLATEAEPTPPPIVEERPEETLGPIATPLNVDSVSVNGASLYGQLVRVENASVGQALSETAFLVQSMTPFVAVMNDDMIAAGEAMPGGSFTLVGTLNQRTDSVLAGWLEDGTVTRSNEMLADFATEYLVIEEILPAEPEGEGMEDTGAAGGTGMEEN